MDEKNKDEKNELITNKNELVKHGVTAITPVENSIEQLPKDEIELFTSPVVSDKSDNQITEVYIHRTKQLKQKVQEAKPLVHHITNFVTMYQCARITSFLGASPVMAFSAAEASDVTSAADALVINTGTLNDEFIQSIPKSLDAAQKHHIPVVLDPVGINLSDYRHDFIMDILKHYSFSVLRCNGVELLNVYGKLMRGSGIDGAVSSQNPDTATLSFSIEQAARDIAKKYHCTVACTGKTDIITDGQTTLHFSRGSDLLPKLVGTGCMMNSLIASFLPVADSALEAAVAGILTMCLASEAAEARLDHPDHLGSFETYLLDAIR